MFPFEYIKSPIAEINAQLEFSEIKYEDNSIYKGDAVNEEIKQGQGRLKFENGDLY